jgi:23S rRNA (pseudouridine1915-N3)-methyltransferase
MRLRVLAVGSRMPAWVREAYGDYITRLGAALRIQLSEIEPGPRTPGRPTQRAVEIEGQRLLAALHQDDFVVALHERGTELSTRELSSWLTVRMREGRDVAFLIGGPDGLATEVLARSHFKWSLSRLTLPHALVRIVLAEQLYRAHGVLANHPYHRG